MNTRNKHKKAASLKRLTCMGLLILPFLSIPAGAAFDTADLGFLNDILRGLLSIKNFMAAACIICIVCGAIWGIIKVTTGKDEGRGFLQMFKNPMIAAVIFALLYAILAWVGIDDNVSNRVDGEWTLSNQS